MMIMSEETYLGALTQQTVFVPVLDRLESRTDAATMQQLRSSITELERAAPGALLQLTKTLIDKSQLSNINIQESFLRLQATAPTDDLCLPQTDAAYLDLCERAIGLRRVLSRIPDEMCNRRTFLETIKEIASCIKKLLDATNTMHSIVPAAAQAPVERRKKEFVHYSKRFSNTLKDYFKGEQPHLVYVSANQLIFQTCLIVRTVRDKTGPATAANQ